MSDMGQIWSQFHPPKPVFTETECPDLSTKVFLVTGGYVGVGYQLARILYDKNAKVYLAGRSSEKGLAAIKEIEAAFPNSRGHLEFLFIDLADLTTIKGSAEKFLAQETRLDVLWNNAGVMRPPFGSKSKQGYELQLGTNCLGHFLLTSLLQPILKRTASSSSPASVRVLFTGSLTAELSTPKGLIHWEDINYEKGGGSQEIYAQSKVGNILLAAEYAAKSKDSGDGVIYMSLNPGNLKTELGRHLTGGLVANTMASIAQLILYNPIFGAYTELFSGLSPAVTEKNAGQYVIPWGRFSSLRKDIADGMKRTSDEGSGVASKFWDWCENETRPYM